MSSNRYQGYPYVNPIVTDAPSIDPATAAKWNNLPRRVVSPSIPGPSGIGVNRPSTSGSSAPKRESEENPVVYIDLPEAGSSDVSTQSPNNPEPEYVQDTILYDPFEDRRIIPKEESIRSDQSSLSSGPSSPVNCRPVRPNTLDFPGSSGPQLNSPQPLPSFMMKESSVYGNASGLPSTIPVSEFPEPPPAYTEVDVRPTPPEEPPRTQVLGPNCAEQIVPNYINCDRKYLTCLHCGSRVHSLVIRETGFFTYMVALLLLCIFFPLAVIPFCTETFKHKNYYCPNCNTMIGYEIPLIGRQVNYVSPA